MKTLCQLVLQYKSDVETRIECIAEEWNNHDDAVRYNEDCIADFQEQIAHWEATLAEINETIENNQIAFELDNPEMDGD